MTETHSNKSFIGMIIIAVLMFIISIGAVGYSLLYPTADTLYKEGKVFGLPYKSDQETVAVKITYFDPDYMATVTRSNTKLYFIQFSRPKTIMNTNPFGYASIEIKDGDPLLDKLKSAPDLSQNPMIVAATIRKSGAKDAIQDYHYKFSNLVDRDEDIKPYAETVYYVSVDEYDKSRLVGYPIALMTILIGLYFLYGAFSLRKKEEKAYNELYDSYPELNHSMDTVLGNATYVDQALGIILYKNHLIIPKGELRVYDLRKAKQMYHRILNHKSYGITTSSFSQLIILTNDKTYRKKKTSFPINNVGKETDDLLQPFFYTVSQEFPDILLGVTNKKQRPF